MKHEGEAYFDGLEFVPLVSEAGSGFRSNFTDDVRFIALSHRTMDCAAADSGAPVAVPLTWKRHRARGH